MWYYKFGNHYYKALLPQNRCPTTPQVNPMGVNNLIGINCIRHHNWYTSRYLNNFDNGCLNLNRANIHFLRHSKNEDIPINMFDCIRTNLKGRSNIMLLLENRLHKDSHSELHSPLHECSHLSKGKHISHSTWQNFKHSWCSYRHCWNKFCKLDDNVYKFSHQ